LSFSPKQTYVIFTHFQPLTTTFLHFLLKKTKKSTFVGFRREFLANDRLGQNHRTLEIGFGRDQQLLAICFYQPWKVG
jgi:hypothetical protein